MSSGGERPHYPILPPLTVSKAVVIFAQNVASVGGDTTRAGLDRLAHLGCSGLLLPRHLPSSPKSAQVEFLQLLGVRVASIEDADGVDHATYATLSRRYGGLKLGVLSNDDEAVDLARRMSFPTVVRLASADAGELLKETTAALQQVDLVLVHIKEHAELRALDLADSLVGGLLEQDKRPLLVSVAGKATTAEGEPVSSKPSSKFYSPVQSSTIIDGKPGAVLRENGALYASYFYEGVTRRDEVQRFHEAEIRAKGCNGVIAAEQFISELAFKLGKTPKYGA